MGICVKISKHLQIHHIGNKNKIKTYNLEDTNVIKCWPYKSMMSTVIIIWLNFVEIWDNNCPRMTVGYSSVDCRKHSVTINWIWQTGFFLQNKKDEWCRKSATISLGYNRYLFFVASKPINMVFHRFWVLFWYNVQYSFFYQNCKSNVVNTI